MQPISPASPGLNSLDRRRHISALDGLRGIAIISVMIFHFGASRLHPGPLRGAMELGWSGVDLFFVLSGFLITSILLRTRGSRKYFRNFYTRRILRILPLYYACVFAIFVVILPFVHFGPWPELRHEQVWYWLHLSNLRTAWGPYAVSPIGHFWSLAVEEQFYFVWPAVVLMVPESWLLWICAAVPVASAVLRSAPFLQAIEHTHPEFLYRMTFSRLDGLALGACVAVLVRSAGLTRKAAPIVRWLLPLSVAALALIVYVDQSSIYSGRWMSSCGYSVLALLFASALFLILLRESPSCLLESPWLRSFGKYSYGMYVFHVPMGFALSKVMPGDGYLGSAAGIAAGVALSYLAAYASWHLFEVRFHRLKDRFAPEPAGGSPVTYVMRTRSSADALH
jgi:peptidoglycan/LPS O-acetylase OafA/YrhL